MTSVLIIPAFEPDRRLLELVKGLPSSFDRIVVVNDGSTEAEAKLVIDELKSLAGVTVLEHAVNLGKGAALKMALNYVYLSCPEDSVIVTADADGQHEIEDILRVREQSAKGPGNLVLGCRQFSGYVPLRSRLGNSVTRFTFGWLTGVPLSDTQTGLRGIPRGLIPKLLKIGADGYDFEIDMLLLAVNLGAPLSEVKIKSVYEQDNPTSHFNPVFDSMKIYFLLFRFAASSLIGAALDFLLFGILFWFSGHLFFAQTVARALAAPVNFTLNRAWVFKSQRHFLIGLMWYFVLVCVNCGAAFLAIRFLHDDLGVPILIAKAGVEFSMFFISYSVQNELIFRRRSRG